MKVGNENCPQWIQSRHWEHLAGQIGIRPNFILRTVKEMAEQIKHLSEELASEQQAMWGEAPIIKKIQRIVAKQVKHTKSAIKTIH